MPGGILGEEKSGCSTFSSATAAAASAASSLGDPPIMSLRAAARVTTEPCITAVAKIGFRRPLAAHVQPPAQRLSSWPRDRRDADRGALAPSERRIRTQRARNGYQKPTVMY